MTEMLLTVALMVAITLDIIRIGQYYMTRSTLKNHARVILFERIRRLYAEWSEDIADSSDFPEYFEKHWNEEQNANGNEQTLTDNVKNEC